VSLLELKLAGETLRTTQPPVRSQVSQTSGSRSKHDERYMETCIFWGLVSTSYPQKRHIMTSARTSLPIFFSWLPFNV
jgi:hypothetical protein